MKNRGALNGIILAAYLVQKDGSSMGKRWGFALAPHFLNPSSYTARSRIQGFTAQPILLSYLGTHKTGGLAAITLQVKVSGSGKPSAHKVVLWEQGR